MKKNNNISVQFFYFFVVLLLINQISSTLSKFMKMDNTQTQFQSFYQNKQAILESSKNYIGCGECNVRAIELKYYLQNSILSSNSNGNNSEISMSSSNRLIKSKIFNQDSKAVLKNNFKRFINSCLITSKSLDESNKIDAENSFKENSLIISSILSLVTDNKIDEATLKSKYFNNLNYVGIKNFNAFFNNRINSCELCMNVNICNKSQCEIRRSILKKKISSLINNFEFVPRTNKNNRDNFLKKSEELKNINSEYITDISQHINQQIENEILKIINKDKINIDGLKNGKIENSIKNDFAIRRLIRKNIFESSKSEFLDLKNNNVIGDFKKSDKQVIENKPNNYYINGTPKNDNIFNIIKWHINEITKSVFDSIKNYKYLNKILTNKEKSNIPLKSKEKEIDKSDGSEKETKFDIEMSNEKENDVDRFTQNIKIPIVQSLNKIVLELESQRFKIQDLLVKLSLNSKNLGGDKIKKDILHQLSRNINESIRFTNNRKNIILKY